MKNHDKTTGFTSQSGHRSNNIPSTTMGASVDSILRGRFQGTINLSGKSKEEAIKEVEGYNTIKIKVKTRNERVLGQLASGTASVALKVLHSFGQLMLLSGHYISDKTRGEESDFEEKYSPEDILRFAMMLPLDAKLTLSGVSMYYPMLSKRQIYKVIDEKKGGYPTLRDARRFEENFPYSSRRFPA